jgi:formate dehydrogenase subunit delta
MVHSQFDDEEHIQTTTTERLVYMANQIARFFAAQPHDAAVAGIAKHVRDFWDPRMRQLIHAHIAAGGAGLDPAALEAISTLPG